jgi:hypothetical protein
MDEFKKARDNASPDVYYKQAMWNKLQDDAICLIGGALIQLEKDLK